MGEKLRLDKLIADMGIATRSEAKSMIRKGQVSVNDTIVKDGGSKIDTETDHIKVNGEQIIYAKYHYYMLNKPAGVISATRDGLSETVLELLGGVPKKNLFPVGRLDKDTVGLLLITDDGKLGHELLSPKHHVDKTYYAEVTKALSDMELSAFEAGVDIGDQDKTLPAKIEHCNDIANGYYVTIHEGRYHQIKRMFSAFNSEVTYLKRISMGPLLLDETLEEGKFRELNDFEIEKLKER